MRIKNMTVTSTFKYLWLKTVTDVDLSQHCAKCLIGEYDTRINNRIAEAADIPLSNSVYYLCGVAYPYNWSKNFHLAFRPCEGNVLTYQSNGISITIEDAIELPIDPRFNHHPKMIYKSYSTCRNWQFANWFNDNLK